MKKKKGRSKKFWKAVILCYGQMKTVYGARYLIPSMIYASIAQLVEYLASTQKTSVRIRLFAPLKTISDVAQRFSATLLQGEGHWFESNHRYKNG